MEPSAALPRRDEFDADAYVQAHPDVAAAIAVGAVASGWQHFLLHGRGENRPWFPQPDRLAGVSTEISPGDEMFGGNAEHYFDVGESARRVIEQALATVGRPTATVRRVLDLPCGHGRVLRFLRAAFPSAEITACDLNRDGVDFCANHLGAIPVHSHPEPARVPLVGGFDLIWCGSLLTHLPQSRCADFLALFHRVLAPGGLAVVTVHGRHYERELASGRRTVDLPAAQIAELLRQYRECGFGYVDYTDASGYGFSLAHPRFTFERLVPALPWRVVGFHEQGWDQRQDVVVLQRPA